MALSRSFFSPNGMAQDYSHVLFNDPFMTHSVPTSRPPTPGAGTPTGGISPSPQEPEQANVRRDPFITHSFVAGHSDLHLDPFMAHKVQVRELRPSKPKAQEEVLVDDLEDELVAAEEEEVAEAEAMAELAGEEVPIPVDPEPEVPPMVSRRRHAVEVIKRIFGPGDPDRTMKVLYVFIFGPWFVFLWVLSLWLFVERFYPQVVTFGTGAALFVCLGLALGVAESKRGKGLALRLPLSSSILGMLGLLATVVGSGLGDLGWQYFWKQYWWMQTGTSVGSVTAATPARANLDAAILDFSAPVGDFEGTLGNTRVDASRSAGFQHSHFYCVAPVLSPELAAAGLTRVEYWAVGIDCCQDFGSFTCDASRDWQGKTGVVQVGMGFPCANCHVEEFRAAVAKAEAATGLVSAPGARFIRWVREPAAVQASLLRNGVLFVVVCALVSLAVFSLVGCAVWYFGAGKPRLAAGEKRKPTFGPDGLRLFGPHGLRGEPPADARASPGASQRPSAAIPMAWEQGERQAFADAFAAGRPPAETLAADLPPMLPVAQRAV